MIRLSIAGLLVGALLGACFSCPEPEEAVVLPIRPGVYQAAPVRSFPGAMVVVGADEVSFELVNPEGLLTRVTYRASPSRWSDE